MILEQKVKEQNGDWSGRRNEVRIDARPSDCLVLALKNKSDLYVTEDVFEQVQDFSEMVIGDPPWTTMENDIDLDILHPRQGNLRPDLPPTEDETDKEDEEDD